MTRGTTTATVDVESVLGLVAAALAGLGEAREEMDALNVYPVPDGDTGTNLFCTLEAGRNALLEATAAQAPVTLRAALDALARGALLGARGSSGVILSQLLGAAVRRVSLAGPDERPAGTFARALTDAADAGYAAVGEPVEGTILSVTRAAAVAATEAVQEGTADAGAVVGSAAAAARRALARTPEQLRVLHDAGVVDAGGRGLCVLLDAVEVAVTGRRPVAAAEPFGGHSIPVPLLSGDLTADGPAYEVMFLLDAADDRIPAMRRALAPLGDSLVVVGGERLWNVHVHVDDVGAAIGAGIDAGRPYRIRVTHFAEQSGRTGAGGTGGAGAGRRHGRAVVVVASGEGLERLFVEAGAVVVPAGRGARPSTGTVVRAVADTGAAEVVILPNDDDTVPVSEAAAREAREQGVLVSVIPTSAQVQGLAALAVHEPGRTFEDDLLHMTAAARHARHAEVTVATTTAMTMAGPCAPGDALGAIEGDFVLVGPDLVTVATGVLERLLGGGGELITLVSGDGHDDLAERCERYLSAAHPSVDVVVYQGGQQGYPLLVAVE